MQDIREINREIEMDLNDFNFEGVNIHDLQEFITKETEIENLFCFFIELFSYCHQEKFQFEKSIEKTLISFVLENLDIILSDVLIHDGSEEERTTIKKLLFDNIICYIRESENKNELLELFTLIDTNYLPLFLLDL